MRIHQTLKNRALWTFSHSHTHSLTHSLNFDDPNVPEASSRVKLHRSEVPSISRSWTRPTSLNKLTSSPDNTQAERQEGQQCLWREIGLVRSIQLVHSLRPTIPRTLILWSEELSLNHLWIIEIFNGKRFWPSLLRMSFESSAAVVWSSSLVWETPTRKPPSD